MDDNITLEAKAGVIDFSDIGFEKANIYELNGEWQILSNQLTGSSFFEKDDKEIDYIKVPSRWAKFKKGKGYATYRLLLKNVPINYDLGIEIINIRSASKVIINDKIIISNGDVSNKYIVNSSGDYPKIGYFKTDNDSLEIIVQVSNFEYPKGGILGAIKIGEKINMHNRYMLEVFFELIMITLVFTIGLLYWILKFFIPINKNIKLFTGLLGLSSIFIVIINSLLCHKIFYLIFPNMEFETASKLVFTSIGILSVLVTIIVKESKIKVFHCKLWYLIWAYHCIYILIVLLTSASVFLMFSEPFFIINAMLFFVVFLRMLNHFVREKDNDIKIENGFFLLGIINYFVYSVTLALYYTGVINKVDIAFLSIVFYSFFLMIVLLYRIDLIVKKNEEANKELDKINKNLIETIDISEKYKLAYLKAQIKPHFLFNTLNTIIGLGDSDYKKAHELIEKLTEYLKSNYKFSPVDELVTLETEIQLVNTYLYIQKQRFEERLVYEIICPERLKNYKIPYLMIQPLVENALIHGILERIEGGKVRLEIKEELNNIRVSVLDDGIGFENQTKKTFSTKIGIDNINQRLNFLYNQKIKIESNLGETKVWFKIPKIK